MRDRPRAPRQKPAELPDPGDRGVPRYSSRPLPRQRYVPGRQPRPHNELRAGPWSAATWPQLEPWLYGIDLFNHFYFWEAHEAWEALWVRTERDSAVGLILQGLIQLAAALLKVHAGRRASALRLSGAGMEKLQRAAACTPRLLGLDVRAAAQRFAVYCAPLTEGRLPPMDASVPVLRLLLAEST